MENRDFVEALRCGAKPGQGCVLADADEAVIVETRGKRLLPLDVIGSVSLERFFM